MSTPNPFGLILPAHMSASQRDRYQALGLIYRDINEGPSSSVSFSTFLSDVPGEQPKVTQFHELQPQPWTLVWKRFGVSVWKRGERYRAKMGDEPLIGLASRFGLTLYTVDFWSGSDSPRTALRALRQDTARPFRPCEPGIERSRISDGWIYRSGGYTHAHLIEARRGLFGFRFQGSEARLKVNAKWPDRTLRGLKGVIWDGGYLRSPHRGTFWEGCAMTAQDCHHEGDVRGQAGIHACWPSKTDALPPELSEALYLDGWDTPYRSVLAEVSGYGPCRTGDLGWRAQHCMLRKLHCHPDHVDAIRKKYRDVDVVARGPLL